MQKAYVMRVRSGTYELIGQLAAREQRKLTEILDRAVRHYALDFGGTVVVDTNRRDVTEDEVALT